MASYQYIYQLQGLTKTYPGGKKVFENIHLSSRDKEAALAVLKMEMEAEKEGALDAQSEAPGTVDVDGPAWYSTS